jgi:Zn-dependent protease
MTAFPVITTCPRCGQSLPVDAELACPSCGLLLHAAELDRLSAEARWKEQFSTPAAIALWEQCLQLLPPNSRQYAAIESEIERLRSAPAPVSSLPEPGAGPVIKSDKLGVGILKTSISMVISMAVYASIWNWPTAIGFVLLIFVHEMGHVIANIAYDLPASAPLFIPFLGAVINLRKMPPNAKVEAIVGIAGPIAGTIGALACFAWYLSTGSSLALWLSWFGFTINLFNLLPVPPLDGGRVAAAISPWIWVLGLAGMAMIVITDLQEGKPIYIYVLVLVFAFRRIVQTLKPKGRSGPYYAIGRTAPVVIGVLYLALVGLLVALRIYTQGRLPNGLF